MIFIIVVGPAIFKKCHIVNGPFWTLLGPFWALLGSFWAPLGSLGGVLRSLLAICLQKCDSTSSAHWNITVNSHSTSHSTWRARLWPLTKVSPFSPLGPFWASKSTPNLLQTLSWRSLGLFKPILNSQTDLPTLKNVLDNNNENKKTIRRTSRVIAQ